MHNHLINFTNNKGNSSKRLKILQRREVLFEPNKKQKPSSSPTPSEPLILTSSRPNSDTFDNLPSDPKKHFTPISASEFYPSSKTFLEKQYEKNLKKFVPTDDSFNFVPLELERDTGVSLGGMSLGEETVQKSKEEADTSILAGQESALFQIEQLMDNSNQSTEMQIAILLHASENFLTKAHSLVLSCNDISGAMSYYSYIRLAMKSLFMVIKEFRSRLSPVLETAIYHKLATIYLSETECLDQAEIYTVSAISMASRHNLVELKVTSELLYCQILELRHASSVSNYYCERQASYSELGYKPIADLFNWARIDNMLVNDVVSGTRALRSFNMRDDVCPTLRFCFLLREATLNLYQEAFYSPSLLTSQVQEILKKSQFPPQLTACFDLTLLATCAIKNDIASGKAVIRNISHFIHTQRKIDWAGWEEDGSVLVQMRFSDTSPDTIQVKLNWVNYHEYSILFYFFSGVLLVQSLDTFKETKKIFEKCLSMVDLQLRELTSTMNSRRFSVQYLTKSIVRLTFIRYSVIFYTTYMDFMHKNDFSGLNLIKKFIFCLDTDNFTKEELCYYKMLIPKFLYLAALGYHSLGDTAAAKFYYYRVRILTSVTPAEKDNYISGLQKQIGVGCDALNSVGLSCELYIFSTVHLLTHFNREIQYYAKSRDVSVEKARTIELSNLANVMQADLEKAFGGHHDKVIVGGPLQQLQLTYQLIISAKFNGKFTRSLSENNLEHICNECKAEGYLKALTTYFRYKLSINKKHRACMLAELAKIGSSHDDGTRLVGILVLFEEKLREIKNGNHSRASKIEARICRLKKNLDFKLTLFELNLNI